VALLGEGPGLACERPTRRTAHRHPLRAVSEAASVPDPAAMVGTAVALDAKGDIACLPAGEGRTTCVLSYVARTAEHCIRAASVPLAKPAHSRALGAATCRFTARA
jgi:hypothetical protein